MRAYGITHTGKIREKNEDKYLVREINDDGMLIAVADGISGEPGGGKAADLVIEMLEGLETETPLNPQWLVQAIIEADKMIHQEAMTNQEMEAMGTTVTAVFLHDAIAEWAHVGDGRLYLFSNNELRQITEDQNMAAFLVSENQITKEDARTHPLRHLLDQSVGCGMCEPAVGSLHVRKGDKILLCTDGLYNEVSDENIADILLTYQDIKLALEKLLMAALKSGGRDNIAAVLAEI